MIADRGVCHGRGADIPPYHHLGVVVDKGTEMMKSKLQKEKTNAE